MNLARWHMVSRGMVEQIRANIKRNAGAFA
jgi:hypothetical protein